MLEVNVKADLDKMKRDLKRIKAAIPSITSRATNELAIWARQRAVVKVAAEIGQSQSVVRNTIKKGQKVPRFGLTKATRNLPIAKLDISTQGIQFTDIAMAAVNPWNKPGRKHKAPGGGVKLKGGRFQAHAFKGKARGQGSERVWLALSQPSPVNKGKQKLGLPRIGLKQKFAKTWEKEISGPKGAAEFRQRFQRLAQYELAKAGIK